MIGATITRVGMPAAVSSWMARRRAAGELVRGSMRRARASSSVVTLIETCTTLSRAICDEQVEIAGDEAVLGDDADRLAGFEGHFEAAAGQAEAAFGRLVAVGDAGEADHLRLPGVAGQPLAKQLGGPLFDEDLRLEVEARAQAEVFVAGTGVAVRAAMLAAAVGVQAEAEGDVGAVVLGDDALGAVGDEFRVRPDGGSSGFVVECVSGPCGRQRIVLVIRLVLESEEAVRGIDRRSPSLRRLRQHEYSIHMYQMACNISFKLF